MELRQEKIAERHREGLWREDISREPGSRTWEEGYTVSSETEDEAGSRRLVQRMAQASRTVIASQSSTSHSRRRRRRAVANDGRRRGYGLRVELDRGKFAHDKVVTKETLHRISVK